MKKRKLICFAICLFVTMTGIISGCSPKKEENPTPAVTEAPTTEPTTKPTETKPEETQPRKIQAPSMTREEFPRLDGSTATIPLSMALYRMVTGATAQEAEAAISHTKTTAAYVQLIYGHEESSLVLAYEPSDKVYEVMKEQGGNLILKPIGKDALVFMANEGNPVESLTEKQLVDIYSGNLKNWSKVGGADKEIMAFQRPENSGSQTLMEKLVMKDVPMDDTAPSTSIIGDMGELIEQVAAYNNQENALGYSVYFYARNMYEKPGLRFMKVNDVLPSNETIKSGAYPYVNEFYAAIREDEPKDSKAYQLFEWLTKDDGQALIESLGYVGMAEMQEEIQVQYPEEVGVEKAQIQFDENQRLLLDGQYAYGTDGVVVLDEQMKITQIIRGARFPSNVAKVCLDEPIILNGPNAYTGLYDLKTGAWLVQPEYSSLYKTVEGTYKGYKEKIDGGARVTLTPQAGGFEIKEIPDNQLADRTWEVDFLQKKAVIKAENGTVINQVDFNQWGNYSYSYVQEPYYVVSFHDNHFMLFDPDGNPLFHKSFLPEAFWQQMKSLNPTEEQEVIYQDGVSRFGDWVCGSYVAGNKTLFIYDIKKKKVMTEPGDLIELYYIEDEDGYIVTRDGNPQVYSGKGEPLISTTGHPYEYVVGGGYYGYQDGEVLILENPKQKHTNTFRVSDVRHANHICGDVFEIKTEAGKGIYKGNANLLQGEEISWWHLNQDHYLATDYKTNHILLDSQGNIVYKSHLEENFLYLCEELLAVQRGNYLHIIDYEGRSAMKILLGYLEND